jgi:hypothetical protein
MGLQAQQKTKTIEFKVAVNWNQLSKIIRNCSWSFDFA